MGEVSGTIEVQSAILHLCLKSKENFVKIRDELNITDFVGDYAILFKYITEYYFKHSEADIALLTSNAPKGVFVLLVDIIDLFAPETLLLDYIEELQELSKKRQLLIMTKDMNSYLSDKKVTSSFMVNKIQTVLSALVNKDTKYYKTAQYLVTEFRDKCELINSGKYINRGLNTGYEKLDGFLHGLEPGNLYTLVALTGIGKSALAINIANNISQTNKVIYYSMEMTGEQLFDRTLSNIAGFNARYLPQRKDRLDDVLNIANKLNLSINDEPALSAGDIYLKTSVIPNVRLLIVDYLHLMRLGRGETQALRIGSTTKELKKMAKKLDMPILLLSQFNRNVTYRSTPEPMLSDIKDSSSIEQDSDVVILLYQPTNDESNLVIKMAKNRQGAKGSYAIHFDHATMTFTE